MLDNLDPKDYEFVTSVIDDIFMVSLTIDDIDNKLEYLGLDFEIQKIEKNKNCDLYKYSVGCNLFYNVKTIKNGTDIYEAEKFITTKKSCLKLFT